MNDIKHRGIMLYPFNQNTQNPPPDHPFIRKSLIDLARPHRLSPKIIVKSLLVLASILFIYLLASRLSTNAAVRSERSLIDSTGSPPFRQSSRSLDRIESRALKDYAARHLVQGLETQDFLEFAYRLRLFGTIFDAHCQTYPNGGCPAKYDRSNGPQEAISPAHSDPPPRPDPHSLITFPNPHPFPYPDNHRLWGLEKELFPWAHKKFSSLQELKASYQGKGIVIPTGSYHLRFAIHLVRLLRHLGCTLSITIAYAGGGDLAVEELDFLQAIGVNTMDVNDFFDSGLLELGGWEIKPFALLASPYEQAILVDADVVFLQNPERLLNDPGYLEHGAIIFHDRTLFEGDKGKDEWLQANLPHPLSSRVRNSRMYQRKSAHEQESGVVVWDKRRRFTALLATCKMNVKAERESVTYKVFYGDKESFWIGLEMAGQSFTDLQPTPGVIGVGRWEGEKGQLVACGRILQFDREGWPLWFNGAIVTDKRDDILSNQIMNFTHFAREGTWDFATSCLDHDVTPINATLKALIDEIASLWVPNIVLKGMP